MVFRYDALVAYCYEYPVMSTYLSQAGVAARLSRRLRGAQTQKSKSIVAGLVAAAAASRVSALAKETSVEDAGAFAGIPVVDDLSVYGEFCLPTALFAMEDHIHEGPGHFAHSGGGQTADPFASPFASRFGAHGAHAGHDAGDGHGAQSGGHAHHGGASSGGAEMAGGHSNHDDAVHSGHAGHAAHAGHANHKGRAGPDHAGHANATSAGANHDHDDGGHHGEGHDAAGHDGADHGSGGAHVAHASHGDAAPASQAHGGHGSNDAAATLQADAHADNTEAEADHDEAGEEEHTSLDAHGDTHDASPAAESDNDHNSGHGNMEMVLSMTEAAQGDDLTSLATPPLI